MTNSTDSRIKAALEDAELAFWAEIAKAFPEAKTGDFGPWETHKIQEAMKQAVELWLSYNSPLVVDSSKWFEAIAQEMKALGVEASFENTGGGIICIGVKVGNRFLYYGTANENWGADVWDLGANGADWDFMDGQSFSIPFSAETEDPKACAVALVKSVREFAAKQSGGAA